MMKRELILLVLHSLLGPVVLVLLGKVQGVVWTATVVGVLMFINKGLMTFIDILKEVPMSKKYIVMTVIDILLMGLFFGYYFWFYQNDPKSWVVLLSLTYTVSGLFMSSFYMDYDRIVKEITDGTLYTNILYLEAFIRNACNFTGAVIAGSMSYCLMPEDPLSIVGSEYMALYIGGMLTLVVVVDISQYDKYYRDIDIDRKKGGEEEEDDEDLGEFIGSIDSYKK
jgi:hypothetical protein